jgi:hypothetical protein
VAVGAYAAVKVVDLLRSGDTVVVLPHIFELENDLTTVTAHVLDWHQNTPKYNKRVIPRYKE